MSDAAFDSAGAVESVSMRRGFPLQAMAMEAVDHTLNPDSAAALAGLCITIWPKVGAVPGL